MTQVINYRIPKNWTWTKLGHIAEWGSGGTPTSTIKEYYGGNIPWLIIGDLNDGFIYESQNTITELGLQNSSAKIVEPDSVLVAMYGSIGKLGITRFPVATNQAIAFTKRLYSGVTSKYLFNYLFHVRSKLYSLGKGGTQKNISQTVLKEVDFPLPPLAEQHRIVAKIEELFSDLDAGIESLKTAQAQLKIYRQAVLKWAFEGKLTAEWRKEKQQKGELKSADELLAQIKAEREKRYKEQVKDWETAVKAWEASGKTEKKPTKPKKLKEVEPLSEAEIAELPGLPEGWRWATFKDVCEKIGDVDHKMPKQLERGYPYVSTKDFTDDLKISFKYVKYISKEDYSNLSKKIKPEKGDIIFPRYGTIGKNILVDFDKEFLVSYSCAIIKPNRKLVLSEYLYYLSLSPRIKEEIKKYTVETTQANVGIESIKQFIFPLSPLEEQCLIVQEIESRLSICDQLEATIAENLQRSEALRQSILKRAFEGKLVPQDPNDEPAEKLLERIKQEKSKRLAKQLKIEGI